MAVLRRSRRPGLMDATLLAHAVALLVGSRIALRLLPWRRAMQSSGAAAIARPASVTAVQVEQAVRRARRFVPGATCLTEALALSRLLSSHGYPSIIRIGVNNECGRFAAHAWVECKGLPLLNSTAELQRFTPLLSWPPSHADPGR
jgi:hypothetical protein